MTSTEFATEQPVIAWQVASSIAREHGTTLHDLAYDEEIAYDDLVCPTSRTVRTALLFSLLGY